MGVGGACLHAAVHGLTYVADAVTGSGASRGLQSGSRWAGVTGMAVLGCVLSWGLVRWLGPECAGGGTDTALRAAHTDPLGIRARVAPLKIMASAVTVGLGGSAGTEGPITQVAASMASLLGRHRSWDSDRARTMLAVSMGAGVAAIFGSWLGGALLGAEVLYRRRAHWPAVLPSFVAAPIAWLVTHVAGQQAAMLGEYHSVRMAGLGDWAAVVVVGLACGAVGRGYGWGLGWFGGALARLPGPPVLRPVLAGCVVGELGVFVPGVFGSGAEQAHRSLDAGVLAATPLLVLAAVPLAKVVATALTVGSGASGGTWWPGLLVNTGVGALLWRVLDLLGNAPASAAVLVVPALATFGALTRTPLAATVIAVQITGAPHLAVPCGIAVLAASAVVRSTSLYKSQPRSTESPRRARNGRSVARRREDTSTRVAPDRSGGDTSYAARLSAPGARKLRRSDA